MAKNRIERAQQAVLEGKTTSIWEYPKTEDGSLSAEQLEDMANLKRIANDNGTAGPGPNPQKPADQPSPRPYIVALEWRRDTVFGARELWAVLSDGTAAKVPEVG